MGKERAGPDPNDRMTCETFLSDWYRCRFVYTSSCKWANLELPSEAAVSAR
jgi:hypothetical protein